MGLLNGRLPNGLGACRAFIRTLEEPFSKQARCRLGFEESRCCHFSAGPEDQSRLAVIGIRQ